MSVDGLKPWEWHMADAEETDRIRDLQHAFREERDEWRRYWREADKMHSEAVVAAAKMRGRHR